MKRVPFLLYFIFIATVTAAQNVHFNSAQIMDDGSSQSANSALFTDGAGNVYLAAYFNLNNGRAEIDVSEQNAAGVLIWEKKLLGGPGSSTVSGDGTSLSVDANGNVYISGFFYGSFDFDPGLGVYTLNSTGSIFVLKLNASGGFVWAKQLETIVAGLSDRMLTVDAAGDIFITGSFKGTIDFDPGPGQFNLISGDNGIDREAFVLKLNSSGEMIWARQLGGLTANDASNGYSIAIDGGGNIYVTGDFYGTVDFDPGSGIYNLQALGSNGEAFIVKLDDQANLIWAKQISGSAKSYGQSVAVDGSGNVYTMGSFLGTADFDPGAGVFIQTANNNNGIFISKLDAAGNFVWANQLSGSGYIGGWGMAIDAAGNSFITGDFFGSIDFNPDVCSFNLSSVGFDDIFVTKLDATGNFEWVKAMGGTGSEEGLSIALDPSGNIYTTGDFQRSVDFDPGPGQYVLGIKEGFAIFLQKMSPCPGNTSSTLTVSACGSYTLNCKTYTSSGEYSQLLSNVSGCDSNIILHLTLSNNSNAITNLSREVCDEFPWKGQTLTSSGIYVDTLVAANGCDSIVNLQLTIRSKSLSSISQIICAGDSFARHREPGMYIDTLTAANGCDSIVTLQLEVLQKPGPDLGPDKGICPGDTLSLFPGEFPNYLWQDGSTGSHYILNKSGTYAVTVSNQCGSTRSEIRITEKICNYLFPNAFTPNKDGKNETFKILNTSQLRDYRLSVFNRWGQKVFETRDYSMGWDGSINNTPGEPGTYVWFCVFKKPDETRYTELKGTVLLLR
jgi:gliding motility-associated-like protein